MKLAIVDPNYKSSLLTPTAFDRNFALSRTYYYLQ